MDLSLISTGIKKWGGQVILQKFNEYNPTKDGIEVRVNVKEPQLLVKLSAVGQPRPYRKQKDFNQVGKFSDRTLTVHTAKYDYEFDAEELQNKYLAQTVSGALNPMNTPLWMFIYQNMQDNFYGKIDELTLWNGVYNAAGTGAVDLSNGWGTIIANEITADNLTPIVTGVLTEDDGVDQVESMCEAMNSVMRKRGDSLLYMSDTNHDIYKKAYRKKFNTTYKANEKDGTWGIDGFKTKIKPVSWMAGSDRLVLTLQNNLVLGNDISRIVDSPQMDLNVLQGRLRYPIGQEIQEITDGVLIVNDQA